MSLFKKFANYCARENAKNDREAERYDKIRRQQREARWEAERKREESRKCCSNCLWAGDYGFMCCKHGYTKISDPNNTVCKDFSKKT